MRPINMTTTSRVTRTITLPDNPQFNDLYQIARHEWHAFPTLATGQTHDLKYDDGAHRVWVSRMRPEDYETSGDELAERLSFERNVGGRWVALDRYGRRLDGQEATTDLCLAQRYATSLARAEARHRSMPLAHLRMLAHTAGLDMGGDHEALVRRIAKHSADFALSRGWLSESDA